jgi:hypothetical protein
MSNETQPDTPAFNEAVHQFQEFLISQNVSSDLLWVFREDASSHKRRILIKEPLPPENIRAIESLYERGTERGLGVRLEALCLLDYRPCCYIWLPEDEVDASYAVLSGLKMAMPVDLLAARSVRNALAWRIYSWLDKKLGFNGLANALPRRNI